MKKIVLTFGLISGVLSAGMMLATVPFLHTMGSSAGYLIGYTAIVLSFLLVFFGIRSYRENVGGGAITFGRAFVVGIGIALISCVFYVVTWEIVYFKFLHGFMDPYFAHAIDQVKASGVAAAEMQRKIDAINRSRLQYANPIYNAAITFMEPFPVGLLMTLLSAAVLRRKVRSGEEAGVPAPVS